MSNRRIIYFTLVLTVLGIIGIYWQLTTVEPKHNVKIKQVAKTVNLLTVKQDLAAGQKLHAGLLSWQAVSKQQAQLLVGAIKQEQFNVNSITDGILAYPLKAGDLLRVDAFVLPSDANYLSVALTPGKRGLAIKVDAQSAMAGLVKPGDQVDVLFYHKLGRSKKDFTNQISASVRSLVTNVKLLAVDRAISRTHGNSTSKASTESQIQFNENSTVTLEVDSNQASKLLIAQQVGQLSLALVSKHGSEQTAMPLKAIDLDEILPELRQDTDIVNLLKGNNEEVFIKNEALMMSTKVEKTGGDDNVF